MFKIPYKIGFIGTGHLAQIIIRGLIQEKILDPSKIFASNRSPGKLKDLKESLNIQAVGTNEEVIDKSDIIILGTKPADLFPAVESVASSFRKEQIVLSLAAGISMRSLKKRIPHTRWARVIPNTPIAVKNAVTGVYMDMQDLGLQTVIEDIFLPFGSVHFLPSEEALEALMVSCSSGTGFCLELMMYFHDWICERDFDENIARDMVVQTFLGAAELAFKERHVSLEELQNKVASKKGVTQAGLQSMRELEIERALRISFEKAALRNQELAKD